MIIMKRILLAFFVLSMALSATAQRVYINPGHGDWGPNSRPMATVNYAAYDTLGFFESNTNLWKAFALQEKLEAAGCEVIMSRTENGPYPYVYGDQSIDKELTEICAEVNYSGADYFISIHSNAYVDGNLVNYPLFLYAGTDGDGEKNRNSRSMALKAWPRHFEAFGNDTYHTNIDHGFEPNSYYSQEEPNLRGDESFYGYNLGALDHSCPGYLVEGYFHTYQPARHRALNPDWCRQEGIRYFRGIQAYFFNDIPEEQVGYIMGCVRDISEWFSHAYYTPMQSSFDPFKPINGAKVVLRDASGNIIRTECYRHVARHITDQYYYTTDHNYNGIFVFENLKPGPYTLTVHAEGYEDKEMEVTVTANKTVYPEIFLTSGTGGTEPIIDVDVQWVLNGGKVDGALPSKIEGSAYTLPTPTKAGYAFRGWFDKEDGTGTKLETLPVDYKGTVYAIWERTSVTWQLNGGHVYPDNQWLWEDFQKKKLGRTELVSVADAWDVIKDVDGEAIYDCIKEGEYKWLGDYLWKEVQKITDAAVQYTRWKNGLYALLNCTTYTYNAKTIDFTEEGKPAKWREFAQEPGRGVDSRFYTPITLPDQITYEYFIPTPEKEGATFQGWYDNPNGEGDPITKLDPGYNSTVYAIWKNASLNKVVWVLNGGHVYPSNDWLWQDFCSVFNEIHYRDLNNPLDENAFLEIWNDPSNNVSDEKRTYYMLIETTNPTNKRYCWLGDYLWKKTETAAGGNSDYINLGNEWWGKVIWAFFNCTTYTYTTIDKNTSDEKTITVDFSVAGQPKSWRTFAESNKGTKNIAQEFYTEITLPEEIDVEYIIPTPEKEGYTFQGWYDNPKGEGDRITVLHKDDAGIIYAIWQAPVPCIVAYDLNCNYLIGKMAFEFSFYANTLPTAGKLIFYNMNKEPIGNMNEEPEPIGEYTINNLRQGKNTVVINAEDIPALNQALIEGRDFLWEVHLEAPPSTLFAEIFRSQPFNTAYATIDNSPESDFFGSIWVANQWKHGYSNGETDGEILRLVPEQGYARDKDAFKDGYLPSRPGDPQPNGASAENEGGFEVIFRPTVAPDGKVYLTDNGISYGGVFVMDPHTKEITNFFDGCNYAYGEWKKDGQLVGSGSTGAHIYWTEDGNNKNGFQPTISKLFLMHNDHAEDAKRSIGSTKGFFVYDLMGTNPSPQRTNLKHFASEEDYKNKNITEYKNDSVTDYAIVGTSRGAWVCQLRNDKGNFFSHPSLTFYPNEGDPTIFSSSLAPSSGGIFGDNELIHGSFGAALAVNKTEDLLAMVGGTGNIMLFDIEWSNETTPTLTNKRDYPVVADDQATAGDYDIPTITTLNFDYAGNLVATLGETYNDASDQHQVAIFTLPKTPNHIDVPSRFSQRVPSLVEDDQCTSIAIADKKYETVEIHRKMQAGMYNTICLPFGIKTLKGTLYEGASVMKFMGTTIEKVGGEDVLKLNFQELEFQGADTMQAGVPYLIQPQQDIKVPVRVSGVYTNNSIAGMSIERDAATFHGITSPTTIAKNPNILFLVANNRLATATVTGPMLGNRAYFELDNAQNLPKRSMISIVKSTPAGFEEIYNTYQTEAYKMLYNGMIVIVRDGVMYDLMGTRIK